MHIYIYIYIYILTNGINSKQKYKMHFKVHTLGAMTPGKSRVGSIRRSTSTPEVYVGLS